MMEFLSTHWYQITGVVFGLIYLYLEYKANIWMWAAGILMTVFYIVIFYESSLYASMGIYIFFLLASIYGWLSWMIKHRKAKEDNKDSAPIERMPIRRIILVVGGILLVSVALVYILSTYTDNKTEIIIGDSLSTSLNIIALAMAAQKWAEQWLLLIPANIISAVLLFMQDDPISGILFIVYFVVSIFGYRNWVRLAAEKQS
ncbi:nicotinamide riboside transporter PnuC [Dysgonomonas massiliensis]|uniref:nicotinamide riboside transporter PnuC n=1 Tax=Dysgonomonas massiliensis TaxID=2040292 RepID=UPI000C77EBDD|nr:nicotinamide riboside transporter PnuC [Dysgonomonas massiliensis]